MISSKSFRCYLISKRELCDSTFSTSACFGCAYSHNSPLVIFRIDNDILNLMDEFDFDIFLKEITDVIGDSEKIMAYMTERSAILVERFLDYLPRMSIPIERVPLQDGWVLTCRSKDGGDLRLSDLSVLRENLHLSVLGSDNVFVPLSGQGDKYIGSPRSAASQSFDLVDDEEGDESVIDEVRELILSAQSHGAWVAGVGGLREVRYTSFTTHSTDSNISTHFLFLFIADIVILLQWSADTACWPSNVRQAHDPSRPLANKCNIRL